MIIKRQEFDDINKILCIYSIMKNIMKKSTFITIPHFMITTIAYALFTISFEQVNPLGERLSNIVDNKNHYTTFRSNSSSPAATTYYCSL